jgi:hypothetical protein
VRCRQHGETVRQSAETTDERKARVFLREKEGKVALNILVSPKGDRLTLDDAATMIREDYMANGRKALGTLAGQLSHLLEHLGRSTRLSRVSTDAIETYKATRLKEGAAAATVNRELSTLRRMASLARHRHGLIVKFMIEMFQERNARKGFFEPADFNAVCAQLRPELAALARAAVITGWRKSELRVAAVGERRLRGGLDQARARGDEEHRGAAVSVNPSSGDCWKPRVSASTRSRRKPSASSWVFARDDGASVGDFKKAWATACFRAGFFRVEPVGEPKDGEEQKTRKVPTKLFHDFRRTAARS